MKRAMDETARRREKQTAFNLANGIVPRGIHKLVREMIDGVVSDKTAKDDLRLAQQAAEVETLSEKDLGKRIKATRESRCWSTRAAWSSRRPPVSAISWPCCASRRLGRLATTRMSCRSPGQGGRHERVGPLPSANRGARRAKDEPMTAQGALRVLMVCSGNICRSPTAEVVLRTLAGQAGLSRRVEVASAGMHNYHQGEAPDRRAQRHARQRGYDLSDVRARQLMAADFEHFDWILVMDQGHLRELLRLRPALARAEVRLLLDGDGVATARDVPDPYYGTAADFEHVLDLVEAGCRHFLDQTALSK